MIYYIKNNSHVVEMPSGQGLDKLQEGVDWSLFLLAVAGCFGGRSRGWFGGGVWRWRKSPSPPGNFWRRSDATQLADSLFKYHFQA